jgi:hypothetical protein
LEDLGLDARIILKWILKRLDGKGDCRLDSSGPGREEQANKLSIYVKFGEFLA